MKTSLAIIATGIALDTFSNPAAVATAAAVGLALWIGKTFIEGLCTPNR